MHTDQTNPYECLINQYSNVGNWRLTLLIEMCDHKFVEEIHSKSDTTIVVLDDTGGSYFL